MYTGDLEPDLEVELSSPDEIVNVSTATSVRILGKRRGDVIFDRAPTDTDIVGDKSVVKMEWQTGDTDEQGRIQIEVEVTWPGARPQTFRADGGVDVLTDFDLADIP
jgi:hypothetical protein